MSDGEPRVITVCATLIGYVIVRADTVDPASRQSCRRRQHRPGSFFNHVVARAAAAAAAFAEMIFCVFSTGR